MKEDLNCSGVYQIRNLINEKVYVGSAVNVKKRYKSHRNMLQNNYHYNKYLQNAWNKYGEDNFIIELVELVMDRNKLIEIEQKWLDYIQPFYDTKNGYNICKIAESTMGVIRTNSAKQKQSLVMSGSKNPMYDRKHTEETKLKISKNRKGKCKGKDHFQFGKHLSKETKEKLSKKKLGRRFSEDELKQYYGHKMKPIIQYDKNMNKIKEWDSINQAVRYTKICKQSIVPCCQEKTKTAGGFIWRYKEDVR